MRRTRSSRRPSASIGSPALDRLADRTRERRVGGPFPEVPRRRAMEVPARAEPEERHADDARERRDRADPDGCGDGQHRRHRSDQRLGNGEADRPRERVDVRGRARDQVAGAGALDGRERQGQHAQHEVLAELGEHLLGEDERRAPGEERENRLGDEEAGEDERRSRRCAASSSRPASDWTSSPSSSGPARPVKRPQPRAGRPCPATRGGAGGRAPVPARAAPGRRRSGADRS